MNNRRVSWRVLAACAAGFFTHLSHAAPPAGFQEQNITRPDGAAQWNGIVGVRFLASGRGFAWERDGRVWIVDPANPSPTPFLDISAEAGGWRDHGMLGFALHPNFVNNGYIYVLYVVDTHHLTHCDSSQPGPAVCDAGYSASTNEYFKATIGRLTRYRAVLPAGQTNYANATTVDYNSRKVLIGNTQAIGESSAEYPYPPLPVSQIDRSSCVILYESHGVGSLWFGQDGTLMASCGDGASYNTTDGGSVSHTYFQDALDFGLMRPKENVGAFRSQLVDTLSGKIWRIDAETGEGIASNPYYVASAPKAPRSRVWALGLRNPFRITIRPNTGSHNPADARPGSLYIGDVGYTTWEDLHVGTAAGHNFGWPLYEGMNSHTSYTNANVFNQDAPNPLFGVGGCTQQFFRFRELIQQDTLASPLSFPNPCNTSQQVPASIPVFMHTRPMIDWRHGQDNARWAAFNGTVADAPQVGQFDASGTYRVEGSPFQGNTSNAGTWYMGDHFPPEYKNTYFHSDYGSQWIRNFSFNSNDFPVAVRSFNPSAGGVVGMTEHPDGTLYYIAWATFLRKVTYVGTGNRPPVAVVSATPQNGPSPLSVQLSSAGSSDPDGQALTYEWNFGDGTPNGSGATVNHVFTAPTSGPAQFTVTLTARDSLSATGTATIIVSPNNTPPQATILSPVNGSTYSMTGNTVINLQAALSDAETGSGSLTCEWLNVLHHNEHTHEDSLIETCTGTTVISPIGCGEETYFFAMHLKVRDPQGLVTERVANIYPRCDGNPPPAASNDSANVSAGGTVNINVLANDADNGGLNTGSVQILVPPTRGTATVQAGGTVMYSNTGAQLPDEFWYTVSDTQGAISNAARVTISATGGGDSTPPSVPQNLAAAAASSTQINLTWNASTDTGTGVVGYRIYRNGSGTALATIPGTSYSDQNLSPSTPYTYRVSAVDGASNESAQSEQAGATTNAPEPDTTPPSVPQNLTAQAIGATRVDLSWSASTDTGGSGLAGYRIYRNGSATALATVTSGTTFSDTTVVANTAYSYQVLAFDGSDNASLLSSAANATTPAAPTWQGQDIGAVAAAGSFEQNGSTFTVNASGRDIWSTSDEFHFVHQPLTGNGEIRARVTSLSNTDPWTKAGVMVRETLGANARFALMAIAPSGTTTNGAAFQYRRTVGGSAAPSGSGDGTTRVPYWLRLVRNGDVVSGYLSFDGVTWTLRNSVTITNLASSVFVGLALTSHLDGTIATAQFEGVSTTGAAPTNQPPTASFTAAPQSGTAPLTVSFNATGSSDSDGTIASYLWDFGHQGSSSSATPSFTFNEPGLYVVTLTVTDDDGATDIADPLTITVNSGTPTNQVPVVNAGGDRAGNVGATIHFDGSATDDGLPAPPGALTISWSVVTGPGTPTYPMGDQNSAHAHPVFSVAGTYVMRLTASDGALSSSDELTVTITQPDTSPPSVPANLTATAAGSNRIDLSWSASTDVGTAGVAGYRVYRNGGTTPIGSVTGTTFADMGLTPSTPYTYTVSAFDTSNNESAKSGEASATTGAPPSWSGGDIGAVAAAGSFSENGNSISVTGSGADIWTTADEFYYVYRPLTGDGVLTARIASVTYTHEWTKAAVMLRESLAANSRFAMMALSPSGATTNGAAFQRRSTTGGSAGPSGSADGTSAAPYWFRIERAGNVVRGYLSPDGQTWTLRSSVTLSNLAATTYVGLAVTSHLDGSLATAVFDNIALTAPEPPPPPGPDVTAPSVPQNLQGTAIRSIGLASAYAVTAGGNTHGIAYGDFNNDGKIDLVTANSATSNASVLLNDGNANFTLASSPVLATKPKSVAVGDLNGDGKQDFVSADQDSNAFGVYLGNGNGTFAARVGYSICTKAHEVALGDLNADGALDVAVACHSSTIIGVRLGTGTGTFGAAVTYQSGSKPHALVIRDFDRDGVLDIVVANHSGANVSFLRGNGNGTLAAPVTYATATGPHSVRAGDFNNDGFLDIATANDTSSGTVSVLLGNGNGTFQTRVNYGAGRLPKGIAVGDVTNDGILDIVATNTGGNYPICCGTGGDNISILRGNGNGTFQPHVQHLVPLTPFLAVIVDLNGDGRNDIATASWDAGAAGIVLGTSATQHVSLQWNASTDNTGGTGVAGYRIYRNGSATPLATVTSTSYSDTTVAPNTAYTYQVSAYDAATPANASTPSSSIPVTTLPN